ncbi:MAG: DUF1624 domain-containing protein [Fimbriiglobus sp.]|jgi:uncharacterized membrane protein|nr:DUF1624 domain-containing protein [Fimbriiglobus sp.]
MRYASIDLLRTLAIGLMVLVHFLENLAGANWTPAGFGAPLFAFLAGLSFRLWVRSQEAKGVEEGSISRIAVRRGLFLFVLGFAFNVLVWLPEDTFNWDVLTMIGTVLVFLGVGRNLPTAVLATTAGLLVVLSPFLRAQADYLSYWPAYHFECDWTLPDVTIGYLATGYFPLFPWAAFPVVGYLAGRAVFPDDGPPAVRPLVVAGAAFAALTGLCRLGRWAGGAKVLTGWTMFPASPEYVCGALAFALLSFSALHMWIDRRNGLSRWPGVLGMAGTMSRHSLSLYLFHHVAHLWPLWVYGAVAADEPTAFWRQAMPLWVALALVPVCLVMGFVLCRGAERWKWPTVEGFMRWLCDDRRAEGRDDPVQ